MFGDPSYFFSSVLYVLTVPCSMQGLFPSSTHATGKSICMPLCPFAGWAQECFAGHAQWRRCAPLRQLTPYQCPLHTSGKPAIITNGLRVTADTFTRVLPRTHLLCQWRHASLFRLRDHIHVLANTSTHVHASCVLACGAGALHAGCHGAQQSWGAAVGHAPQQNLPGRADLPTLTLC